MISSNLPHTFKIITLFLAFTVAVSSCKKDKPDNPNSLINELAYKESKDWYLWTEKLPSQEVFNPGALKDIFAVMDKIKSYQKLDKWSFAETKEETELSQNSSANDFGFMVKFASDTEIRVIYVYDNSSAGLAGVKRTWILNRINQRTINYTSKNDLDYINDILFGNPSSASFEFRKPDNSLVTITLQKAPYQLNTVLFSKVYLKSNKKIGYVVFNQFGAETSSKEFVDAIESFQGADEVIVDLRYNRGGYVSTQDVLANMLAPLNVGRGVKTMYTYVFNSKHSEENTSYKFQKAGSLNLSRVFFIVSSSSASASELLINNLRGLDNFEVVLIGDRTYGKPVGFFPIPVKEYNVFPVSFKTVNSKGFAEYYEGFAPTHAVRDDIIHDFGDEQEENLKMALSIITGIPALASSSSRISSVPSAKVQQVKVVNDEILEHLPSVTIEDRPSRMPKSVGTLQR
jgi:C-terminal processing protease CtpA/Prc